MKNIVFTFCAFALFSFVGCEKANPLEDALAENKAMLEGTWSLESIGTGISATSTGTVQTLEGGCGNHSQDKARYNWEKPTEKETLSLGTDGVVSRIKAGQTTCEGNWQVSALSKIDLSGGCGNNALKIYELFPSSLQVFMDGKLYSFSKASNSTSPK
jgi:hypothetical protein